MSSQSGHPLSVATVTGAPALIVILVILALLVLGVVSVIRFIARRARD